MKQVVDNFLDEMFGCFSSVQKRVSGERNDGLDAESDALSEYVYRNFLSVFYPRMVRKFS